MDRFAAVQQKIKEVNDKALALYGVDLSIMQVSFKLRGRVAGWASRMRDRTSGKFIYRVKFNQDMINGNAFDGILNNTVSHEIAHIVCYMRPDLGDSHNAGWRRVCLALGGNGERCHQHEVQYAAGSFDYITDRGHKVTISKIIHNKIQQQRKSYRYRNGKGSINFACRWSRSGEEMPVTVPVAPLQQVAPIAAPRIADTGTTLHGVVFHTSKDVIPSTAVAVDPTQSSEADAVRIWIRYAKQHGESAEKVVNTAMVYLGMPRALATTYVKNNWSKVG